MSFASLRGMILFRDRDGLQLLSASGQPQDVYVREEIKRDIYKKILGDSNASVSIGLDERIGGPYGYSSVGVKVMVTVRCDQSQKALEEASSLAFQECVAFLEDRIEPGLRMLEHHLDRYYQKKD